MNPNNMQQQNVDMTPEEAKASLGLATRLSGQMLMAQNAQIAPQDTQNAPQQDQNAQPPLDMITEIDNLKTQFMTELGNAKEETKKIVTDEINKLRDDIKNAISEEPNNE